MPLATGAKVRVTSLERTLIDVTVRPGYAGGVESVLSRLVDTLADLDYVYPFHQAIGFYMERAGFPTKQLAPLKALGMDWDFYLAHNIRNGAFNRDWRIHHPKGL